MKTPAFTLTGEVTSFNPKGDGFVVIMNLLCEIDKRDGSEFVRDGSEFVTWPVTLFGDHAGSTLLKAPIGSRIEIACRLTTFEANDGRVFYNVNGGDVKVLSLPSRKEEPFPPVEDDDDISDLPF